MEDRYTYLLGHHLGSWLATREITYIQPHFSLSVVPYSRLLNQAKLLFQDNPIKIKINP